MSKIPIAETFTCAGQTEEGWVQHVGHGKDGVREVYAQLMFAEIQERHWGRDMSQSEVPSHDIPEVCTPKAGPHLHAPSHLSFAPQLHEIAQATCWVDSFTTASTKVP